MHSHQMISADDVREFALAGNARLTLVSKRTGTRFTYRIRRPSPDKPHFVALLTQPDNENGYTFLGTIFLPETGVEYATYRHGRNSSIAVDAEGARAFEWFFKNLRVNRLSDQLEVWHEGRCGRCGRPLTVPESIINGLGPECIKRVERRTHSQG
jgi:hypothetical protein